MARRKKQNRGYLRAVMGVLASLAVTAALVALINGNAAWPGDFATPAPTAEAAATPAPVYDATPTLPGNTHGTAEAAPPEERTGLALHIIDVGDGDCLLLEADGHNMLIDAGHNGDFNIIDRYLKQAGVRVFELALATHPHEDHIGSMDAFIKEYKPGRVLLSPRINTTKHYENMLDALIETGIKAETPRPGDTYALGGATLTVLAPVNDDYGKINDFSVVLRVDYGGTSFLLTGDAEKASEADMLEAGGDVAVTVLKLAHHGSSSSTTKAFLKAASPAVAVVSADKAIAVAKRLEEAGVPCYSTGDVGDIVLRSDGRAVTLYAARLGDPVIFSTSE